MHSQEWLCYQRQLRCGGFDHRGIGPTIFVGSCICAGSKWSPHPFALDRATTWSAAGAIGEIMDLAKRR